MRNLILIITLLFSFNAIGAATKPSRTGLEGWGKNGVRIIVYDYSKLDKNFPLNAIKTKVELRLLQVGIKVVDTANPIIHVNAQPIDIDGKFVGYAINIQPQRLMFFRSLDDTGKSAIYTTFASRGSYVGKAPSGELINNIDSLMDELLLNHLKANPKKKE